eukprot:2888870-Pleurochrysis_carterae.AAC.2
MRGASSKYAIKGDKETGGAPGPCELHACTSAMKRCAMFSSKRALPYAKTQMHAYNHARTHASIRTGVQARAYTRGHSPACRLTQYARPRKFAPATHAFLQTHAQQLVTTHARKHARKRTRTHALGRSWALVLGRRTNGHASARTYRHARACARPRVYHPQNCSSHSAPLRMVLIFTNILNSLTAAEFAEQDQLIL